MSEARSPVPREIGRCVGGTGPTVVLVGALHGNEPAGRLAIQRVFERLDPARVRGRVVGLTGNRRAFAAQLRYLERDLNRDWTAEALASLLARESEGLEGEDLEQLELLRALRSEIDDTDGPVTFLDLHTMSGPGAPFACMADVLRNRRIAFDLPLTVVLGLEEVIEGSLLGYLCDAGHVGVAVEGGQHQDPASIDRLEAAAWMTLVSAGVVDRSDAPAMSASGQELFRSSTLEASLPSVVEIRHRHVCQDDDGFEMRPGWRSFQGLHKGEVVASDHRGEIRAPHRGLMLLPRYQGSGSDGYFIVRPVRKFWLELSRWFRRLRLDRWLPSFPGVRRHPERAETYLVDPRWARMLVVEVFHLFGYRRVRPEGAWLTFSRRRPDGAPSPLPGLAPSAVRRS